MDYSLVLVSIVIGIVLIILTRIVRKSSDYELKLIKKEFKALENYTSGLEEENKSLKTTMSRRERGPSVPPDGNLLDLLPNLLGDFGSFAPKWLRPFLGNKEIQAAILAKVQENPEKFAEMFGKLIRKKEEKHTIESL